MNEKRQLEVLAPAGDLGTLKAALLAGADAVYFGGEMFGARAYAHNFSLKDAQEGISFAHARGRRAYLTVNTLLKTKEIEQKVYDYLKAYYEAGIDAVLVQDAGLMELVRSYFPELGLHISTQANVTSAYGARFFKNIGAKRIVLARELSLREIKQIHEGCDIELECFAHGALCMSYSGQCLMSSMIGGRSGNRGRCAQPCRKCYGLTGTRKSLSGRYPLSLKDLCTILDVKALYDAGCCSLKIEGRMKSPEYVANAAAAYRWAADIALSKTDPGRDELSEKKQMLLEGGSRGGGTDRYLFVHNDPDMVSLNDSAFKSSKIKSLKPSVRKTVAYATLRACIGSPLEVSVTDGRRSAKAAGDIVEQARKPQDIADELKEKITRTGDDRITIDQVHLDVDCDAFIPVGAVKELRRKAVYEFLGGITVDRVAPCKFVAREMGKTRDTTKKQLLISCVTAEQLKKVSAFRPDGFSVIIALNYGLRDLSEPVSGCRVYLCMPEILRNDMSSLPDDEFIRKNFDGLLVSSYDEIEYAREHLSDMPFITDQRIYVWSDRSREAVMQQKASALTAPVELNEKELSHLDNSRTFLTVYGRTPLMYTATCQHKNADGCDRRQQTLYLCDERKAVFPVINYCSSCTNVVYNSLPTSLLPFMKEIGRMGFYGYRIDFTTENSKETEEVLDIFYKNVKTNASDDIGREVTRGHFHRGAE